MRKACRQCGCAELVESGYCKRHEAQRQKTVDLQRNNKSLRKLYRSARWRKLRAEVLAQTPLCPVCRLRPTDTVHHDPEATFENFFDLKVLHAICAHCHSTHHLRERHREE